MIACVRKGDETCSLAAIRHCLHMLLAGGSTGTTKEEVERNIQEAIEFHLEGLRQEGYEIPEPGSYSAYVDIVA